MQAKDKVIDSLKSYFRPEFLNRLDEIIVFDILSTESIREIVQMQVAEVQQRLALKDITLTLSKDSYDYITKEGYDPRFGARPLKRVIQSKILTPVASQMVEKGMLQGGTVKVSLKKGELVFDVKKKGIRKKKVVKATKKKAEKKVAVAVWIDIGKAGALCRLF
jgi:ATP-dependent Clp protease ATP-binding subunit ClpB